LYVVEDAAQACLSTYKGRQLGTIGDLGCFSFHETKNIISGEGGALMVNNPIMIQRAEIIREKGTNRSRYIRGEVDKYTWIDIGSSYLPGEIVAAFLWAQMENAYQITDSRKEIWERYDSMFLDISKNLRTPFVPDHCVHNGHMYYVINESEMLRNELIEALKAKGISSVFHYVPLHTSPFTKDKRIKNSSISNLPNTEFIAKNLIRLPIWVGISKNQQLQITKTLKELIS